MSEFLHTCNFVMVTCDYVISKLLNFTLFYVNRVRLQMWIAKSEYDESGPSIVHRYFVFLSLYLCGGIRSLLYLCVASSVHQGIRSRIPQLFRRTCRKCF